MKNAVLGMAQKRSPALAEWIEGHVSFPGTMVDRIVPAATEASLAEIADALGVDDPCAISCEPFIQWVVEDNFVAGRPEWEVAGVQMVQDVLPWEQMKLRILNGSHSFWRIWDTSPGTRILMNVWRMPPSVKPPGG